MTEKIKKGLVLVFTGQGKGKTSAALGTALRSVGHGQRVAIIQFIKGTWHSGELEALKKFPQIEVYQAGAGFYQIREDKLPEEVHQKAAQQGLQLAQEKLFSKEYNLVILDEINNAVETNLIDEHDLVELIKLKPLKVNLLITGRNAKPSVIELADLVTEMKEIKHPFNQGILAKKGIDY